MAELSTLSSSIFNEFSQSTKRESGTNFLDHILSSPFHKYYIYCTIYLLSNIYGIIANYGRWSEIMAVKLPNIMSGPITFEKILSIKVLQWLIIVVGFKIEGIDELEVTEF